MKESKLEILDFTDLVATGADGEPLPPPPDFKFLDERRFDYAFQPPKPLPVWTLAGMPISTAGNLTVVQAKAKAGKSAALSAMIAAIINPRASKEHLLGFEANPNDLGQAVLHFDTEQSRYDHDALVRLALRRAHTVEPPHWLRSYCLTGVDVTEARAMFFAELARANEKCGGIHSVLLDGVADICHDPNDPKESFALVTRLHSAAIEYDCPLVCVLHENPGSEIGKTRGHLGSQLERKAETPLRLEKDKTTNITVMFSELARHGFLSKQDGPGFRWNDDAGMHMACSSVREGRSEANLESRTNLAKECFRDWDEPGGMPWAALRERVFTLETVGGKTPSLATAERRIKDMSLMGIIRKTELSTYTLISE